MINEVVAAVINRSDLSIDRGEIAAFEGQGLHIEFITRSQAAARAVQSAMPIWLMLAGAPTLFLIDRGVRYASGAVPSNASSNRICLGVA
jgi:hypothetical protein